MTDWYRRKTWTKTDEDEFFVKLGRARKYNRPQYLRIQAGELMATEDKNLLFIAEMLLNRILTEYPENLMEKSSVYNSLGQINILREKYETALACFQKALDAEKEFPHSITSAYLNFSETVIRTNKTELYEKVENIFTQKINNNGLYFPVENYIMYSVMAVIAEYKRDFVQAQNYAEIAEKYATTQTNSLWNPKKKKIGVVKKRKSWLDKLVGRK